MGLEVLCENQENGFGIKNGYLCLKNNNIYVFIYINNIYNIYTNIYKTHIWKNIYVYKTHIWKTTYPYRVQLYSLVTVVEEQPQCPRKPLLSSSPESLLDNLMFLKLTVPRVTPRDQECHLLLKFFFPIKMLGITCPPSQQDQLYNLWGSEQNENEDSLLKIGQNFKTAPGPILSTRPGPTLREPALPASDHHHAHTP